MSLLLPTAEGLYCPPGAFHVDPWAPVEVAVLTHGHADHARAGCAAYHCSEAAAGVLRRRLGADAPLIPHPYRVPFLLGAARVSLHPAGHVLGSAQVRVEHGGQVWVVSGDYKRQPDPTCAPFEPVRCDTFVTEATFGLPVYRWPEPSRVVEEIAAWWASCRERGQVAALFCHAFGKAQRLLAELSRVTAEPVHVHGAVETFTAPYREAEVALAETIRVTEATGRAALKGALVLAPPAARRTAWMKRLGDYEAGFASGFMQLRGLRRRAGYDRGFVLSDHADWPALLQTVEESSARQVLVTHGYAAPFARYLQESGRPARAVQTPWQGEVEL